MKKTLLLFVLCVYTSCQKIDLDIENLNGNRISALGHGGMGISHTFPMNSYESILYALHLGADGSEVDVEMTIDSVLVAFHDKELSVKTNLNGNIYEKSWEELKSARYIHPIYTNYSIVSLDQLFSGIGTFSNKIFSFDCKNYSPDTSEAYRTRFCIAVLKVIDKYNLQDNVIVEVKREDILQTFKQMRPDLKIFIYADFEKAIALARQYSLQGLVIAVSNISKDQVKYAHDNGFQVAVFNAHSRKGNKEAIEKHVDFIQSDNLPYLLRLLN